MNYLDKLNPEQREAATTIEGPLLIIAGAGSGKTTVLVNRLAYMIEQGINPKNILMLTFTNKAARNMVVRTEKLIDDRCKDVTACTYHSFCAHILRVYAKYLDLPKDFSIISSSDTVDTLALVKAKRSEYYNQYKKMPNNRTVLGILSKSINMQMSITDTINTYYPKYKAESDRNVILELIRDYRKYKKEKDMLDYDDLLTYACELLEIPEARQKISHKYQYIMVDEYQDTNALQDRILFLLCDQHQNLAVVGDDYQSIYAFRGSDINNILNFPQKMPCKQVMIDTNYRSTKEILDLANHVMKRHADFGYPKMMKAHNRTGDPVQIETSENQEDEAYQIANSIEQYIEQGVSPEEIAVLERNSSGSMYLELLLQQKNIPFRKLGGLKFMEQKCIQDMLAFLKILTNITNDEISWFRILDIIPGIGDAYANRLVNLIQNPDFLVNNDFTTKKFYPYLVDLQTAIQRTTQTSSIEEKFDIAEQWYLHTSKEKIRLAKIKDEADRRTQLEEIDKYVKVLDSLKELLCKYETILEFLDSIALDANPDFDEDQDMVTISTIHSAKGLEWEVVFILDCINGVFPKEINPGTDEYQEELRCFYVAITRAKQYLYIQCPKDLEVYGMTFQGVPSAYLQGCQEYYIVNGEFPTITPVVEMQKQKIPLTFQLVPESVQFKNLRSELTDTQWDIIKMNVKRPGVCACCGTKTPELDAHEVWNYNDKTYMQTLDRIIPVCKQCHKTIHIGHTQLSGEEEVKKCILWYAKQNHISLEQAYDDFNRAANEYEIRNQHHWTQMIDPDVVQAYLTVTSKSSNYTRHYLNVPYSQKDDAKKLGARWDPTKKKWYYTGAHNDQFKRWEQAS